MSPLLFKSISDIALGLIDRFIPDNQKQAEAQLDLQKTLLEYNWKAIETEFSDLANARGLAEAEIAKSSPLTSFLAAAVRPVWGIGAFALVAYSFIYSKEIDSVMAGMIEIVIQFYFGGRVIEKIAPIIGSAFKKS